MRYGYWRTDKPTEDGFSPEFISCDSASFCKRTNATLDTLYGVEGGQIDTLLKAFKNNIQKMPHHKWLGTRFCHEYIWDTFAEVGEIAENLSYGLKALGLCPEIHAEGTSWKFLGI